MDNIYNVTVQVSDGTLAATQDIIVTITTIDDNSPVITSNGNLSIAENTAVVTTVTATDADLPAETLTYSIVGGADSALFTINSSTGELTFIAAPDFEAPKDAGIDNIYNVTVQTSDGTLTAAQDIVVTVTAVNDNNPVITSNGSLAIAENSTAVITVTATDADLPAQTLTYSISGGADSALFSINSSTGELTFIAAPDFEAPKDAGIDNIYNVTVQASDGTLAYTQDIVVAVSAVNDNNPVITSNGNLSITENTMVVTTVTATDADQPAQTLTYSISGGADSALFSINSSTGELTFIAVPDFEVPTDSGIDNIYNVTVQASDGSLTTAQNVSITVKGVVQPQ
jgi:serralysin